MATLISESQPTFRLQTPGVPPKLQAVIKSGAAVSHNASVIRHALSREDIVVHFDPGEDYLLVGATVRNRTQLSDGRLVLPDDLGDLVLPTNGPVTTSAATGQAWDGPPLYEGKPTRPMCIDCGQDFANAGLLGKHRKRDHAEVDAVVGEPETAAV